MADNGIFGTGRGVRPTPDIAQRSGIKSRCAQMAQQIDAAAGKYAGPAVGAVNSAGEMGVSRCRSRGVKKEAGCDEGKRDASVWFCKFHMAYPVVVCLATLRPGIL